LSQFSRELTGRVQDGLFAGLGNVDQEMQVDTAVGIGLAVAMIPRDLAIKLDSCLQKVFVDFLVNEIMEEILRVPFEMGREIIQKNLHFFFIPRSNGREHHLSPRLFFCFSAFVFVRGRVSHSKKLNETLNI
jgi:hypothetical protein